jgi:hypothetical protein
MDHKEARFISAWATLRRVCPSLDGVSCDSEPTHASVPSFGQGNANEPSCFSEERICILKGVSL